MEAFLRQDEEAPTLVVPTVDGWMPADTPEQVANLANFGGQQAEAAIPTGHVQAWRPCHDHFPQPDPISSTIYVEDDDSDRLREAVHRIWPELRPISWIDVPIDPAWKNSELLDHQVHQRFVIDAATFPPLSTWRALLLEINTWTHTMSSKKIASLALLPELHAAKRI